MKNQASGQFELSSYSCFWHLFFAECNIGGEIIRNELIWPSLKPCSLRSRLTLGGVDHTLSPAARPWAIRFDSCQTSAVDWRWWMILHIPVVLLSRNATTCASWIPGLSRFCVPFWAIQFWCWKFMAFGHFNMFIYTHYYILYACISITISFKRESSKSDQSRIWVVPTQRPWCLAHWTWCALRIIKL